MNIRWLAIYLALHSLSCRTPEIPGALNFPGTGNGSATDRTPPSVTAITADAGSNTITIEFSEPVYASSAGSGALAMACFGYTDGNAGIGATGLASVSDGDGSDRFITLIANQVANTGDGVDQIVFNAASIYDAAGNPLAGISKNLLVSSTPLMVTSAQTMDIDDNGFIDHYKLTFNKTVTDATFPGYVSANALGTITTNWQVAGYTGVRIDTRDAAPPTGPGDTGTNDNVVYLAFSEKSSYDTNQAPDITTIGAGVQNPGGLTLADLGTGTVNEADGVAPGIARISVSAASTKLIVEFYERVYGQNNASGNIPLAAFSWLNNNAGGATAISAFDATPGNSPGTQTVNLSLDALATLADGDNNSPDDVLALVSGQIFDAAGNTGGKTKTLRFGIQQIAIGANHICALSYASTVRCWGYNSNGQLGYGHTNNLGDGAGEMPPADVPLLSAAEIGAGKTITQIALGSNFSCALLSSGSVRCWGYNVRGQLGYGNMNDLGDGAGEMPPADVNVGGTVTQIALGDSHTCALLTTGSVRCWGYNVYGQLGYGHTNNLGDGAGEMPPADVNVGGTVTKIAAGLFYTCAVLSTGSVRCWGCNTDGQLGYGNTNHVGDGPGEMPPADVNVGSTVSQIALGSSHSCALLSTGNMRCWGYNGFGQLGYGHLNSLGDGAGEMPPADIPVVSAAESSGGKTITQIALGAYHSCVLVSTGTLRCWGYNAFGQLGYGNTALLGDSAGELPTADVNVGGTSNQIALGGSSTCARFSPGSMRCWGRNTYGQLGYGNTNHLGDNGGEMPTGDTPTGW